MRRMHARAYAAVLVTAAFFSLCVAADAAWIPLKAAAAQWLIERSWQRAMTGAPARPPWPWADTTPAGILRAPGPGVRLHVLHGASGRNLAFGPVLLDASAGGTDIVISGHRDTHFRFLRELEAGDLLHWTAPGGSRWYRVSDSEIVDSETQRLIVDPHADRLSLVSCYPFDSALAGGPLRYVVTAYPLTPR